MTALEKQQKKISVIIPVYNAEKYIRETLDSIIKQSYKNREIILIENGSKDRGPHIIQEYAAKYPEIHIIKGSGKGPGAARNRGMRLAKALENRQMQILLSAIMQGCGKRKYCLQRNMNPSRYVVLHLRNSDFRDFSQLAHFLMYGESCIEESF